MRSLGLGSSAEPLSQMVSLARIPRLTPSGGVEEHGELSSASASSSKRYHGTRWPNVRAHVHIHVLLIFLGVTIHVRCACPNERLSELGRTHLGKKAKRVFAGDYARR